jgi:hypothetical protein
MYGGGESMNRKINRYVNYLTEHDPSAFCDYILCKEVIGLDERTVKDSYDWAVQFGVYNELKSEQFDDGSWGGFATSNTELSKKQKYKTTGSAIHRMVDLALDISDPMVLKTVEIMYKYLSGEVKIPDSYGKNNMVYPLLVRRDILRSIAHFIPDDENVTKFRNDMAEILRKSYADGEFNSNTWNRLNINDTIGQFSYNNVYMLHYGNCIDDDLQEKFLRHEWNSVHFGDVTPLRLMTPDEPLFHFWLWIFDKLQKFSLFPQFMADKVEPHLFEICDRLIDERDNITIYANKYGHIGRYSESWKLPHFKKRDLLLRLVRILNKC